MAEQEKAGAASLEDLLARCALRDRQAFAALYAATSANLFGIALRILKTRPWAEEVLQESFVKVWQHADRYDAARGAPMTWLINIVRNQALDTLRRADFRADQRSAPIEDTMPDAADGPLDASAMSDELARLQRCLDRLAADQRACVMLVHHEGYTPAEVAKHRKLPLGTVKTWIRRGLIRVRECMQP
jgi:RNA polymerase sigma-70 factor (ECF subfamily)